MRSAESTVVAGTICCCVFGSGYAAEGYPTRPIRLIIPYSAGGAADVPGRIVAQEMSERLAQQLVVDNRPGAGSLIGAELAARATPDGYTLLLIANTHYVTAALRSKIPFRPVDDFTHITEWLSSPSVLVVHPSLPAKTVRDLIAMAQAAPGKIDFASSGNGSTQHLLGALLMHMARFEMTHIAYKGSGPAMADLLGGQVKVGFPGIALAMSHLRSGKLRALGVSSSKRSPALPDVPTIAEAGVPGYDATQWVGFAGPKGLPQHVVDRIFAATRAATQDPDVVKGLRNVGGEVQLSASPQAFLDFSRREAAKWARVVKESGAKVN
ncbi:MAG: tripartite tricarboxylate transporter substrate binding protein [Burkholderiales bacterium]|nr:tripartite tricarboxylate transporter substrate binding protein [Burkholderiales bacterium]